MKQCCSNCCDGGDHDRKLHAECRDFRFGCVCPCHAIVGAHYVDSRTPEEKEQDAKMKITITSATGHIQAPVEAWEKEFDRQFDVLLLPVRYDEPDNVTEDVKAFVRKALSSQRASIREMVRGLKYKECLFGHEDKPKIKECASCLKIMGYNQAISDILSKLDKE